MIKILVSLILILILILILYSKNVLACSCVFNSLVDNWKNHEHVFIANPENIEIVKPGNSDTFETGVVRSRLNVTEMFKGNAKKVTFLEASHLPVCCDCSTKLVKEPYLVFSNAESGSERVSDCSATIPLSVAPYQKEVLLMLKNDLPTKRFTGIFNAETETILLEEEVVKKHILEFFYDFQSMKSYVDIEAYELNDGSLFFIKANSVIALNKKAR